MTPKEELAKLDEIVELAWLGFEHKDCDDSCSEAPHYKEAKAKLTQLLLDARIGELESLKQYADDYPPYIPIGTTRQFCEKLFTDRIAELKALGGSNG